MTMKRKLVAALACRASGQRLYGKPVQNLERGRSIIDHILSDIACVPEIDEVVLGIAEGRASKIFLDVAKKHDIPYLFGKEEDALWRLILCARMVAATDVFRITTECPFIAWEFLSEAWRVHVENDNDITITDYLPDGMNFEIYKTSVLLRSHKQGGMQEHCSAYGRSHPEEFKISLIRPPEEFRRPELRFTVDQPEDLVLCRNVYLNLKQYAPKIPVDKIIEYIDMRADLKDLVKNYVDTTPLWANSVSDQSIYDVRDNAFIKEKI